MTYPLEKIILFEVDQPINLAKLINYNPGIWYWKIINTVETVTDDHETVGYYQYQYNTKYAINSLKVDNVPYTKVYSIPDLKLTENSFFYEPGSNEIYIHFEDFDPPLNKEIFYGASLGYSKLSDTVTVPFFSASFYAPLIKSIPSIKKSVDPLFFGVLKYVKASVTLINSSGEFDDWRDRDFYGQPARIKIGNPEDDYADFDTVFEGFISDDDRDHDEFKINIEDPRRALTQPVASNKLTLEDWPDLKDSNVNNVKPVAYGPIFNAECICLNEEDASAADRIFLICDTEYNPVYSLDTIYVNGVETAITGSADLAAGTFTMTKASVFDNFDEVSADFVATRNYSGVDIIKDLMLNYDDRPYISSLWDTAEIDSITSRDSSLYVDKGEFKLAKAIESVCIDIDGRFFAKNNGLYTIRLYDEDRTPNDKEIYNYEWGENLSIQNNGSQFLSSVIVEYQKDMKNDGYLIYENTVYENEVFNRYKKKKVGNYKTGLPTLADAQEKSETIMNISKNVQDVVSRSTFWNNFGIEPTDFVICSPSNRVSETPVRAIYEVLKVNNNTNKFTIDLDLRYVKDAEEQATYTTIDDNNDNYILDHNDLALVGRTN